MLSLFLYGRSQKSWEVEARKRTPPFQVIRQWGGWMVSPEGQKYEFTIKVGPKKLQVPRNPQLFNTFWNPTHKFHVLQSYLGASLTIFEQ